ncbi:hypothetical protein MTO96_009693 [Rhipicephalus appendiculatus]
MEDSTAAAVVVRITGKEMALWLALVMAQYKEATLVAEAAAGTAAEAHLHKDSETMEGGSQEGYGNRVPSGGRGYENGGGTQGFPPGLAQTGGGNGLNQKHGYQGAQPVELVYGGVREGGLQAQIQQYPDIPGPEESIARGQINRNAQGVGSPRGNENRREGYKNGGGWKPIIDPRYNAKFNRGSIRIGQTELVKTVSEGLLAKEVKAESSSDPKKVVVPESVETASSTEESSEEQDKDRAPPPAPEPIGSTGSGLSAKKLFVSDAGIGASAALVEPSRTKP